VPDRISAASDIKHQHFSREVDMDALTLFIIRHAEKPGDEWPGQGLMPNEISDTESLVLRGWQRAGAWTALFGTHLTGGDYAKPDVIYAATPGANNFPNQGPSRRPAETISVLAARLKFTPNEGFGKGAEQALVNELLTLTGVALVCWEHKAIISDILPLIPVSKGKPPSKWEGTRFDVVLRFDRAKGDDKFAFTELFPKLLPGDSDTPLGS
jgi:hypothetical protein